MLHTSIVILLLSMPSLAQVALPDVSLFNWATSVAATPAAGPYICVTKSQFSNPSGLTCGTIYDSGTPATDLTNALANLACDQIVVLADIQYKGNFNRPQGITCAAGHWMIVEWDITNPSLVPEHFRADPCYIGIPQTQLFWIPYPTWDATPNTCSRRMPQIISNATSGNSGFAFNPLSSSTTSLNQIRYTGLDFTRDQSFDLSLVLVDDDYQPQSGAGGISPVGDCAWDNNNLPTNALACMNDQPVNVIYDRCIFHGDAQRQTAIGIKLAGERWVAVKDSFFYDIGVTMGGGGGDGHAFGWGTGHAYTNIGEGLFVNNTVSSSTMASEYCGAWDEPLSPATGHDGIPTSVLFFQNHMMKNPLWDVGLGQFFNESLTIEGHTYSAMPQQEFDVAPHAIQLQLGHTFQFNVVSLNDVGGTGTGINRMTNGGGAGSVVVDGVALGNSTVGIITKTSEHNVGSGAWLSQNQITWAYTACTGVGTPIAACTGATTTGAHSIVFTYNSFTNANCAAAGVPIAACTGAGTPSQGQTLPLSDTATVTVTSGAPTSQIAVSPASSTLSIQPSYSDSYSNVRQFCLTFFENANYTPGAITWKVDGIAGGNSSAGTITSSATGLAAGEAAYCSGTSTGTHTITATDGTVSNSSTINVTTSAAITGYDLKPYTSKNAFELKCGSRIEIAQNFLEVSFGSQGNGGGQDGTSLIFQVGNQASQTNDGSGTNVGYGPQHIDNITVDRNKWADVAFGAVLASLNAALGEHYVSLTNNVWDDMTYQRWSNGFLKVGQTLQYSGTPSITVLPWTHAGTPLIDHIFGNHLTAVAGAGGVTSLMSVTNNTAQFVTGQFVLQNSILASDGSTTFANNFGDVSDCNTATGSGANNTEARAFQGATSGFFCASPYTFNYLALVNSTASPTVFVSSPIWQPAATATDLFASYSSGYGGDYRVCTGVNLPVSGCTAGTYAAGGSRQASDGLALGADVAGVNIAVINAKSGIAQPYNLNNPAPAIGLFSKVENSNGQRSSR